MKKFEPIKLVALIALFLLSNSVLSQIKDEREVRVAKNSFPMKGQSVLKELPKSIKKLKLYKEIDGEKVSYEAKFKHKKKRYSVEFDTNGTIEDIELIVKEKSLPMQAIESYLKSNYSKFNIIKIQTQFINSTSKTDSSFLLNVLDEAIECKINYELIIEVKTESVRNIQELLFSESGEFTNSRILTPSSYEYIMY